MNTTSSDSKTSKSLPCSGTNYVSKEIIEPDSHRKKTLAALASDLIREWLNEALDNFEITFTDSFYRSDSYARNGNHNQNQATSIANDLVMNSVPSLKQLCLDALDTSDNHLMNVSVSQFYDEERQAHGKRISGAETFFCHSVKQVKEVKSMETESDHADNYSQHNSASSSFKVCDLSNLQNLLTADSGKAELDAEKVSQEVVQNVDSSDETQIETPISRLLPTVILNSASSTIEDVADSFNTLINSNSDSISANIHGLISSQEQNGIIACKVTNSSSDTLVTDARNSTSNGRLLCLFGPGIQVTFSVFCVHSESFFHSFNCTQ